MLVYTGTRLAHPSEFFNVYRIGREQLAIFVVTLVVVLATDLLIGVAAGVALKTIIHLANGVPLRSFFKAYLEVEDVDDQTSLIIARESAVFSNWIPFRRQIEDVGLVQKRNLILDLSGTTMVDASVMEKLEELQSEFHEEGLKLELRGLDDLRPASTSAHAARHRGLTPVRRLTVVVHETLAREIISRMLSMGASGYTEIPCRGAGRAGLKNPELPPETLSRIEVIAVPELCEQIVEYFRTSVIPKHHVTMCVETVEVARMTAFAPEPQTVMTH
jgi:hypothetical protein